LIEGYLVTEAKSDLEQVYRTVGERIRDERKRQNITQDELALQVGLTRTSITNMEKGRQKLLLHTLIQIANILGIPPARLLPTFERETSVKLPEELPRHVRSWIINSISTSSSNTGQK
jgi:transcriptional regulator with XRE-family HTH domain